MQKGRSSPARAVALVGIMAASLECAKLALAALPNIEAVTLLTALYGYAFGWAGVIGAVVFVSIEPLIWGFGTWVVAYYIHWPLVAFIFMLLGKVRIKNRFVLAGTAVLLTACFGVLTSLVELGLLSGFLKNFWQRFAVYYARGLVFYIVQVSCNAVLFLFLFNFLAEKLFTVKNKFI